jgi:peptidoglycan/xylan/chitin deacetylase (PgdA/CDA1 family)
MVNTEYLNHGANLLMHDRAWTRDASAQIVEGLRNKGYALVDPETIASSEKEAAQ